MINSRQCTRYSKVALVAIAHRLKLELPKKVTKESLCALIKNGAPRAQNNAKLVSGANANFKLQGRICGTWPKKTLIAFAKELGGNAKESNSKVELCKMIERLSKNKRLNNSSDENFNYFMQGPRANTS
jgi:hypothetical protein